MGGFGVGLRDRRIGQWGERQTALLRPYVERWVEAVPRLLGAGSTEEAENFTEYLYRASWWSRDPGRRGSGLGRDPGRRPLRLDRRGRSRPIIEAGRHGAGAMRLAPADIAASRRLISGQLCASSSSPLRGSRGTPGPSAFSYPQGSSAGNSGELTRP